MLVPLKPWYSMRRPPPAAENTSVPVATSNGVSRPSAVGPWLLKAAMSPPSSVAPTLSEFFAAAKSEKPWMSELAWATT